MRCGYTVVPKELVFNGTSLNPLWARRQATKFNGVSYITQRAAEAIYTEEGQKQIKETLAYYQKNARVIYDGLCDAGFKCYGGVNSPYVWLKVPEGYTSWEFFDELLEKFGIFRPKGESVMTLDEALQAANRLEYPVLLRPSYVIGGQNMTIAYTDDDVKQYMAIILAQGIENPVLVDKYMMGTELEVDCISDGNDVLIPGIMEHIERAGVHSGDSIAVYPPYNLNDMMLEKIPEVAEELVRRGAEVSVFGLLENAYDVPEHRMGYLLATRHVAGYGGEMTNPASSISEANVIRLRTGRYATSYPNEMILVHEFGHAIHLVGMNGLKDQTLADMIRKAYQHASDNGLWPDTYAISNYEEYFATLSTVWFLSLIHI